MSGYAMASPGRGIPWGTALRVLCVGAPAEHLRGQLESLFNEMEVDLVLSGHVHSYARTCNVLNEHCVDMNEGGMTHITLGCGGHKL